MMPRGPCQALRDSIKHQYAMFKFSNADELLAARQQEQATPSKKRRLNPRAPGDSPEENAEDAEARDEARQDPIESMLRRIMYAEGDVKMRG